MSFHVQYSLTFPRASMATRKLPSCTKVRRNGLHWQPKGISSVDGELTWRATSDRANRSMLSEGHRQQSLGIPRPDGPRIMMLSIVQYPQTELDLRNILLQYRVLLIVRPNNYTETHHCRRHLLITGTIYATFDMPNPLTGSVSWSY